MKNILKRLYNLRLTILCNIEKLNKLLTILFSVTLISILFYNIIFKKRFNIALFEEKTITYLDYFLMLFLIYIGLCIFICITIILNLKKKKKENVNIIFKFSQKVTTKLIEAYSIIFKFVGYKYTSYIMKLANKFLKWRKYYNLFIFLGEILPRVIILFIFILEIYLQHLHYYFYSLFLLIIPLIFRFIIFTLTDIGPRMSPELKEMVEILPKTSAKTIYNNEQTNVTVHSLRLKPEYSDINSYLFFRDYYDPMMFIAPNMDVFFLPKYLKARLFMLFIYMFIHAIGWGYILFYTFLLFY